MKAIQLSSPTWRTKIKSVNIGQRLRALTPSLATRSFSPTASRDLIGGLKAKSVCELSRRANEDETMTKDKAIDHAISVLVIAAALSIPSLLFAAYWFNDGTIAAWAIIPFIFFMAG